MQISNSAFHFPGLQFSASIQELSSCSRSIKLLRELYSLQVTYNPLWRRLRHQNTSRRTVQKLQVRRKVVVYSKVILLWEMLQHSVLEITQLTDFFIGAELRDLNEICYVNEEFLYTFSSFLRRLLWNGSIHRQLRGRSSQLCWATVLYNLLDKIVVFHGFTCSSVTRVWSWVQHFKSCRLFCIKCSKCV